MNSLNAITVLESLSQLEHILHSCKPQFIPRINLLIALKEGITSYSDLTRKTNASRDTIRIWKKKYAEHGINGLLIETRGGSKESLFKPAEKFKLQRKLRDNNDGFNSYWHATLWVYNTLGKQMSYDAVRMYLRRNYGDNCIVRKRPIDKSETLYDLVRNTQHWSMTESQLFQKLKVFPIQNVDNSSFWKKEFKANVVNLLGFNPFSTSNDNPLSDTLTMIFKEYKKCYYQLPKITGFTLPTLNFWRENLLIPSQESYIVLKKYISFPTASEIRPSYSIKDQYLYFKYHYYNHY